MLYVDQVKQRSRDAILVLELLTKLNEGVDIRNMMEGNFDFSQFQVHVHTLASSPDSLYYQEGKAWGQCYAYMTKNRICNSTSMQSQHFHCLYTYCI